MATALKTSFLSSSSPWLSISQVNPLFLPQGLLVRTTISICTRIWYSALTIANHILLWLQRRHLRATYSVGHKRRYITANMTRFMPGGRRDKNSTLHKPPPLYRSSPPGDNHGGHWQIQSEPLLRMHKILGIYNISSQAFAP